MWIFAEAAKIPKHIVSTKWEEAEEKKRSETKSQGEKWTLRQSNTKYFHTAENRVGIKNKHEKDAQKQKYRLKRGNHSEALSVDE